MSESIAEKNKRLMLAALVRKQMMNMTPEEIEQAEQYREQIEEQSR